jgi:hypothetical protein
MFDFLISLLNQWELCSYRDLPLATHHSSSKTLCFVFQIDSQTSNTALCTKHRYSKMKKGSIIFLATRTFSQCEGLFYFKSGDDGALFTDSNTFTNVGALKLK